MISTDMVRALALSFEDATESPHFEKTSFRIRNKIFATMDLAKQQVVLKLSEIDQSVFCDFNPEIIYPVTGAWGKKGWTLIELETVPESLFMDALTTSYCSVAPKKLAAKYQPPESGLEM